MNDEPDYYDPKNPPRRPASSSPSQPPAPQQAASPMDGPAQGDPRSPVRKVLDLFALDSERSEGLDKILLAAGAEAAAGDLEGAAQRVADAQSTYTSGDIPGAPPVTTGAAGADVHVSLPRVPFHDWSLSPGAMPAELDVPVRIPLADVVALTVPTAGSVPDDDDEEESDSGPPSTEESWWTRLSRKLRELESKVEHDAAIVAGVNDRVSKIQTARAFMPVIPQGKTAGTLQRVPYQTIIAGRDSTDTGWMFVEPATSEYGQWFAGQMRKKYDDARAAWRAMPDTDPAAKKRAWGAVGNAATCIGIAGQEAAPSGINTYDGRVLSWGIGLAAPGELQKVLWNLVQDPKVQKVLYCCGFSYGCDIRTAPGARDQYHGIWQTVDLTRTPPAVVYGDNFHHRNNPPKHRKGDFNGGNGYLALKPFVAQLEMLYMLIQVARDPETRDTVFKHNYDFISGAANVKGYEQVDSEALYVFIAQVQHNWGISRRDPVGYAISTMDAFERALPRPSPEADKAIAKGVVRLVAMVLQEQKFQNAVKAFRTGNFPTGVTRANPIWMFPGTTEWGPTRMLEHYWMRLKKGERSQDGSKVEVPGFLVSVTSALPGNYLWRERPTGSPSFDLGPASRMGLRFEHDDFVITSIQADGRVVMTETVTGKTRLEDPTPR